MRVEVDMSGKIEQTEMNTVVAFRNKEQFTVLLQRKIKTEFLTKYRSKYKDVHYRLFAILIYYCIKDYLSKIQLVIIDNEYEGREEDVKRNLLRLIWKTHPNFDKKLITISRIGKKSNTHRVAYQTFVGKLSPNKIITKKEVEELI